MTALRKIKSFTQAYYNKGYTIVFNQESNIEKHQYSVDFIIDQINCLAESALNLYELRKRGIYNAKYKSKNK